MLKGWYLERTGGTGRGTSGTQRLVGPTRTVSSNIFRIECDLDATLVDRVPESSAVPVAAASVPVAEPESLDVVGVITTRQHSEVVLADPELSLIHI